MRISLHKRAKFAIMIFSSFPNFSGIRRLFCDRLAWCINTVARIDETANPVEAVTTHSFAVYLTPASASCTVSFTVNDAEKYSVEVYNAQGQMLFVADKGEAAAKQSFIRTINTSQLKTGAYFIKLVTTGEVQVKQMIIQR
jgi:hypothetical protein